MNIFYKSKLFSSKGAALSSWHQRTIQCLIPGVHVEQISAAIPLLQPTLQAIFMSSFGNKEAYIITLPQTVNRLQGLAAELGRGFSGNRGHRSPERYTLVLASSYREEA